MYVNTHFLKVCLNVGNSISHNKFVQISGKFFELPVKEWENGVNIGIWMRTSYRLMMFDKSNSELVKDFNSLSVIWSLSGRGFRSLSSRWRPFFCRLTANTHTHIHSILTNFGDCRLDWRGICASSWLYPFVCVFCCSCFSFCLVYSFFGKFADVFLS